LVNNKTWHVEDSRWKAKQILTILSDNNISPKTICEVGCGAGEILKQISSTMPSTSLFGYELSPQAFELCKTRETERVRYYLKNVLDEDIYFDCLLCIDVFEHVDDYLGFVKSLKPKSTYKVFHIPLDIYVLAILRGSFMKARKDVGHLHYFTKETAIATLQDCGYEIVDHFYTKFFCDLPSKTFKATIAKLTRNIVFAISPDLMVKVFGGCSLIVLCK